VHDPILVRRCGVNQGYCAAPPQTRRRTARDTAAMPSLAIGPAAPASAAARELLRAYFDDVASRYLGRAATACEVDAAMRDDPSDDLAVLLGAWRDGVALGCSGLRLLGRGTGEVTRVFVRPQARRQGIGSALLRELEAAALARGVTTLRLDTRHDLVEARSLYAAHGYREVPAFNDAPYAEHWFAKAVGTDAQRSAEQDHYPFGLRCNGAGSPCDMEGDERTTSCPPHRRPGSDP